MAHKKRKDKLFRDYVIPLSHQVIAMEAAFPSFKAKWDMNVVTWTGTMTPSPLSLSYLVQVKYSLGMSQPKVSVLSPKLEKRGTEDIPHVYPGEELCLFRPRKKEWTKDKLIADTIIPWISLWLYHYEIWHVTGEWLGGGEHPNSRRRGRSSHVQNSIY
ncbi:hypothetical protein [Paenibacillus sp. Y412MC10]|uniref:hypothetical protein n=1 Tax=Geobacillus sp. (strain Y412MC10) TaxID=481743 RepID=UPI001C92DC42|nr:hypothetical protein [Paenibacillus sp. Y412MC10]